MHSRVSVVQCLSVCPLLQVCCCGPGRQETLINCCMASAQHQRRVARKCRQCHAVSICREMNTNFYDFYDIILRQVAFVNFLLIYNMFTVAALFSLFIPFCLVPLPVRRIKLINMSTFHKPNTNAWLLIRTAKHSAGTKIIGVNSPVASRSVQPFLWSSHVCPTQRHISRLGTSVTISGTCFA